jgi:hypothetical protein
VQAAGARVHRDTMGSGNGGLVALCRMKKDGDAPFIGELKAVERLTCAPRRGKAVRVAAWAVGAATTSSGLLANGGEAVRWTAGERETRGAGQRHV